MIQAAGGDTPEKIVDHLARRFLSVTLAEKDRAVLVDFLSGRLGTTRMQPGPQLEDSLRELLYLLLSTPQYQLGLAEEVGVEGRSG
jgi:hypothetical protein